MKIHKYVSKWVLVSLIFGFVLFWGIYFFGTHGESFQFVKQVLISSPEVEQIVGRVKDVRVDPKGGYVENFINGNKVSEMHVDIFGEKGKFSAVVIAHRSNEVWWIDKAMIDGRKVKLDPD